MAAYFSEVSITGASAQEFLEIAVTEGTDTSGWTIAHYVTRNGDEAMVWKTYALGTVESTTAGFDVYTVDDSDPDVPVVTEDDNPMGNIYPSDSFALVDDQGNVVQYISFYNNTSSPTSGPAAGMTSTMIGTPARGESLETSDGGSSYSRQSSPSRNTIPCFLIGTQILTALGYKTVEHLRLGDLVETADHGLQPIRWIKRYRANLSKAAVTQKPVCIKIGALGPNCPTRDLTLSPQHRVAIATKTQVPLHRETPKLAPAKALTNLQNISHLAQVETAEYIHFACPAHEVIWANGAQVETLFLSKTIVSNLPQLQRRAIQMDARRHQLEAGKKRAFLRVSEARRLLEADEIFCA